MREASKICCGENGRLTFSILEFRTRMDVACDADRRNFVFSFYDDGDTTLESSEIIDSVDEAAEIFLRRLEQERQNKNNNLE